MRRLLRAPLALVALAVLLAGWRWLRPPAAGPRAASATPARLPSPARPRREPPAPAVRPGEPASAPGANALEDYRRSAVYPPSSRRLTRSMVDLLEPDRRYERAQPVPGAAGLWYLWTADRYWIGADEAVTATLESSGRVDAAAAELYRIEDGGSDRARVARALDAQGGRHLLRVRPAALALGSGHLELALEATISGHRVRDALRFRYSAAGEVAGRFTGVFEDRVQGGSLLVRAGVVVARAGYFVLDCNLYDAAGEPVAWARAKQRLEVGPATVDLVFFGKVLRDAGGAPPFRIGELRGVRVGPDGPEPLAAFAGDHRTRAYAATDFSDAPYDSPAKRARIAFLESQLGGPHALLGSEDAAPR